MSGCRSGEHTLPELVFRCAKSGDLRPALERIAVTEEINRTDRHGLTALERAVQTDCIPLIDALLTAGADANAGERRPPLAGARSAAAARLLLAAGASSNGLPGRTMLSAGDTPLIAAAMRGLTSVIEVLLEYGADIDVQDRHGRTALLMAVAAKRRGVVALLLRAGAHVGLVEAAALGDCDTLQRLLDKDTDQNLLVAALNWAARADQPSVLRRLLRAGAPVDGPERSGVTPLMRAAQSGHLECISILLEHGADVNARTDNGSTALGNAMDAPHRGMDVAAALLEAGADPNIPNYAGWAPLHSSTLWQTSETVELLLTHGANPNVWTDAETMSGEQACSSTSPLELAVLNGRVETARRLLRFGADRSCIDTETLRDPVRRARMRALEIPDETVDALIALLDGAAQ